MAERPEPQNAAPTSAQVLSAADPEALALAAAMIREGRLVAFPTETVYGLGANALDGEAVRRIFSAKERPAFNPVIVHLADLDQLPLVCARVPKLVEDLAAALWPGPLTLVLPRSDAIPDLVTAGLDTVGVRIPAHPVARRLIELAGVPIAAPSANLYTRVSPTTAQHVVGQLGSVIDLVLDGGPSEVGLESTVLDVSGERPVLLRPGGVSVVDIESIVGPVRRLPPHATTTSASSEGRARDESQDRAPRPSPGMTERHYAPRARLLGFSRERRAQVRDELIHAAEHGRRCGLLAFDLPDTPATIALEMPRDAVGFARMLFAALHRIDDAGCEFAFVEELPTGVEWDAVADRLRRAGLDFERGGF